MKRIIRPLPKNNEIILDPYQTIMSKTDPKGIITYANEYFIEIAKYKVWELMGQPHNVIRHPDMPKIIFKILWDRLFEGKNIHAVVKNLAKDGSYYWVVTDFYTKYDEDGNIVAHYSRRKAIPKHVKHFFENLYKRLINIEQNAGMEAAGLYLNGFLEDANQTYDEFILSLFNLSEEKFMDYMRAEINDEQFINGVPVSAEDAIRKTTRKKGFLGRIFG